MVIHVCRSSIVGIENLATAIREKILNFTNGNRSPIINRMIGEQVRLLEQNSSDSYKAEQIRRFADCLEGKINEVTSEEKEKSFPGG